MAVSKVVFADEPLVDLTGDTVTADTLAQGVTAHDASGVQITGTLDVAKPTLFAPVITNMANNVTWANNAQNGGFDATLTATVDGTVVSSPLAVTAANVGKTLTVTATADGFIEASTTYVLAITTGVIKAGTYTFVNKPTGGTSLDQEMEFRVSGTSGYEYFVGMGVSLPSYIEYYKLGGGIKEVFDYGSWISSYRTITVLTDQTVSAEFYNWFITNLE